MSHNNIDDKIDEIISEANSDFMGEVARARREVKRLVRNDTLSAIRRQIVDNGGTMTLTEFDKQFNMYLEDPNGSDRN